MLNKGDRYIVLSFDTESDIGSWTQNYTSIDEAMPKILDLLDKKKIKATFYWEARAALHNPGMVRTTALKGHECGCHTYQHETVGKPAYFIPGDRAVLPDEVFGRLEKNKRIVENLTGVESKSFRAPRLWGDEIMIKVLEELKFRTDSTYQIRSTEENSFWYHPSENDLGREGDLEILELPIMSLFGDMIKKVPQELRDFGFETSGNTEIIGQWPVLRLFGGKMFVEFSKPYIEEQLFLRGYSVITIYQHPWEFIPMPGILDGPEAECHLKRTLYENSGDIALKALEEMITLYIDLGFKFITAADLAELVQ